MTSRATYQVITTSSSQGFYEKFMGDKGSLAIDEVGNNNQAYAESDYDEMWSNFTYPTEEHGRLITKDESGEIWNKVWERPKPWTRPKPWMAGSNVDSRATKGLTQYNLAAELNKLAHTPHLEKLHVALFAVVL